jgi:hypothetical protein
VRCVLNIQSKMNAQTVKLIGWPQAGFVGHTQPAKGILNQPISWARARAGAGARVHGPFLPGASESVGFCQLPTMALIGGQGVVGLRGDITGFHKGQTGRPTGAGRADSTLYQVKVGPRGGVRRKTVSRRKGERGQVRGKVARPVGSLLAGDNPSAVAVELRDNLFVPVAFVYDTDAPLYEDRRQYGQWLAGRSSDLPDDGYSYNLSQRLLDVGQRAAIRQARKIRELRGVNASQTSLDDAAGDAVVSILQHVRGLVKTSAAHWDSKRFLRVVRMYANRGAFNSLAGWASVGLTGNTDNKPVPGSWSDWLTETLADVQAPAPIESEQAARRSLVRWVYDVGLRQFTHNLPAGRNQNKTAIRAARSRCRVVGNVILGASLYDACALSGFGSAKSFVESCKTSGFLVALEAASERRDSGSIELARIAQRRYALEYAQAIREQRKLSGPRLDNGHGVNTGTFRQTRARGQTILARLKEWQRLGAMAAHALTLAKHYKGVIASQRAANRQAFGRISAGMQRDYGRFDNLRHLLGLVDAKGRSKGGINSTLIRAAKGKVSRQTPDVATVSLAMGRNGRKLPCAKLA